MRVAKSMEACKHLPNAGPAVDDPYVVGGATDYLYPTYKRNFGFVSFWLHIVLPSIVFLVGGFFSIWTLTHLNEV